MDNSTWVMEEAKLIVTGTITLVAAVATVFIQVGMKRIAQRQADIAQEGKSVAAAKLKLDLFEKRFEIYRAARDFIVCCGFHNQVTDEDFEDFELGIKGARWLFDEQMEAYFVDHIRNNAIRLQHAQEGAAEGVNPERPQDVRTARDFRRLFQEEIRSFDTRFDNYLRIV